VLSGWEQWGSGIVEVISRSGYSVIGVEMSDQAMSNADSRIRGSIDRGIAGSKITEVDGQAILSRIELTTSLVDLAACDLVIEAITEDLGSKSELFITLDSILGPDAIMATNTSALSVTQISVVTSRPSRVIGMHFSIPPWFKNLLKLFQP